jgi:hypothetical protein
MNLMRACKLMFTLSLLVVPTLAPAAGVGPHLQVVGPTARVGQWIKVKVQLVSDRVEEVEFAPKDVFVELTDGSKANVWRWESFFPEASANLKKGDKGTSEGTKVNGKIVSLSYLDLKEGSTATIKVPLVPGKPQEAVLYFEARTGAKVSRLVFGKLSPVKLT